ncbi:methyltransferase domain-containing protein [Marinactinospora endophytica]
MIRAGARIARVLTAKGAIQDPKVHRAVLTVHRDAFVPATVWAARDGWYEPRPRDTDPEVQRWLGEDVYLVTQVDDGRPDGEDGRGRIPTSSLSQPSLVVRMLQELAVSPGDRVLEIGTGSGYNTALLCELAGEDGVVSVELDETVAETAREALTREGCKPRLLVGDGAREVEGGPFDRVIATVGVRHIPAAWISGTRPGGLVLAPWTPGLGFTTGVLALLEVAGDGTATGRIVSDAGFMMLREHRLAPLGIDTFVDEDDPAAVPGETTVNPRLVTDRDAGWRLLLGHLVPGLGYASWEAAEDNVEDAGEASVYVYDRDGSGSWALGEYSPEGGPFEVKRCGPRDLWAEVGAAREVWLGAGRPGQDRFGLTVTSDGEHRLWVDEPGNVLTL